MRALRIISERTRRYELTSDAMADQLFENLVAYHTAHLDHANDGGGEEKGSAEEALAAKQALLEMAKGQGINAAIRGRSELKCGVISSVLAALAEPDTWHLNAGASPAKLLPAQIMAGGLRAACTFLRNHLGNIVEEWRWGRMHICHFNNAGAGQLGDFLNAPPFESGECRPSDSMFDALQIRL